MPGGVLSVIAAMRRFSFHAGVQELGCQALQNLAATASDSVKLAAEQGLQAVRRAPRAALLSGPSALAYACVGG